MTSVERVMEYTVLPSEAALDSTPENKPPEGWPFHGRITGEKTYFRYSPDGPYVLNGLNFSIKAKEKVSWLFILSIAYLLTSFVTGTYYFLILILRFKLIFFNICLKRYYKLDMVYLKDF